jgi:hypothetical protein
MTVTSRCNPLLVGSLPAGPDVIEQAPVPNANGHDRGVVTTGPVGIRSAGRFRIFRYEVRCWLNGVIPDLGRARSSPMRVSDNPDAARRILAILPSVPTPTWGGDELHTGEMWNSNSVVAWALARSGLDLASVAPPAGGRAPGWGAGIEVAQRDSRSTGSAGDAPNGTLGSHETESVSSG